MSSFGPPHRRLCSCVGPTFISAKYAFRPMSVTSVISRNISSTRNPCASSSARRSDDSESSDHRSPTQSRVHLRGPTLDLGLAADTRSTNRRQHEPRSGHAERARHLRTPHERLQDTKHNRGKPRPRPDLLDESVANVQRSREVRPPDWPAFEAALSERDRVGSWLKFQDILLDEEARKRLKKKHFTDVATLLLDHRPPKFEFAELLLKQMSEAGFNPTIDEYNMVSSKYASIGKMVGVRKTLEAVYRDKLLPNTTTYNHFIRAYGRVGDVDGAVAFFDRMTAEGVKPDVQTYNELIEATGASNIDVAKQFHKQMIAASLQPDERTYSTLIRLYVRADDLVEAERAFAEKLSSGFKPDKMDYTTMMGAFSRQKQLEKVSELFDQLVAAGIKPDAHIFNTIIHAKANLGDLPGASAVVDIMLSEGVDVDAVTFSTLIAAHAKAGKVLDAEKILALLRGSEAQHVRMQLINSYRSIITAYAKKCNLEDATRVLHQMEQAFIPAPLECYNEILEAAAKLHRTDVLETYWALLTHERSAYTPNEVSYATVIRGFIEAREVNSALDLWKDMGKQRNEVTDAAGNKVWTLRFEPAFNLYLAVLDCAIQANRWEDAVDILVRMRQSEAHKDRSLGKHFEKHFEVHSEQFEKLLIQAGEDLVAGDRSAEESAGPKMGKANLLGVTRQHGGHVTTEKQKLQCKTILALFTELTLGKRTASEPVYRFAIDAYRVQNDHLGAVRVYLALVAAVRQGEVNMSASSVTAMLRAVLDVTSMNRKTSMIFIDIIRGKSGAKEELKGKGVTPTVSTPDIVHPLDAEGYGYLLQLQMRNGRGADVISTLLDMESAGFEPTARVYQAALGAANTVARETSDDSVKEAISEAIGMVNNFVEEQFPELLQNKSNAARSSKSIEGSAGPR
ncbi:uncharacterized protein EV422DRAFT_534276 [Fimicolochytrium jonesii]|uniref:uncharacterized protein n=1 Tax=Fimicolochytrium jonesii TaxID=1396493 RepID=UPI0022FDC102|nr:uncharacterized protein EV422DRAFT_534276 [Fimicolochytrium jonesii]KAI8819300.1 hypothetical protein EV422DRAFT_534276 [Fimicolochytrium jonesii]